MCATGELILRALSDDHPAEALARLTPTPRLVDMLSHVFVVALRRSFPGRDVREVTAYVRDLLAWLELPVKGESARETEAMIRAALGEPGFAGYVPASRRYEIICRVASDLSRPPGMDPAALAALVEQGRQRVDRFAAPVGRP
jgi:hypothetical protein